MLALLPQLAEVARLARRRLVFNASLSYQYHDAGIDGTEYTVYSESAVFLAFVEMGGDYDHPEAFDFVQRRRELLRRTEAQIRAMLRSEDQNVRDQQNRNRERPEGVDEMWWDAWRGAGAGTEMTLDTGDPWTHNSWIPPRSAPAATPQDALMRTAQLDELRAELARLLSPADCDVLTQHYLDEVPQCEIAAARGGQANAVNVQLHRARARLRAALPEFWHDLLVSG